MANTITSPQATPLLHMAREDVPREIRDEPHYRVSLIKVPNKSFVETAVSEIWSDGKHDRSLLKFYRDHVEDRTWASILWGILIEDISHVEPFILLQFVYCGVFNAPNRNRSSTTVQSVDQGNVQVWRDQFISMKSIKVFRQTKRPKQVLHEVSLMRSLLESPRSFEYKETTDIDVIAGLFTLDDDLDPMLDEGQYDASVDLITENLTMKSPRKMGRLIQ